MITIQTKDFSIKNIDTVLFDKDGTIIDLHYFWGKMTELRVSEIIRKYNLSNDCFEKLSFYLGFDIKTQKMLSNGITALYSRSKIIDIFKDNLVEFDLYLTAKELEQIFDKVSEDFYDEIRKYIKPIPSAISFIKYLHSQNIKLGIVTSDSIVSTNLALNILNLEGIFSTIVGRESSSSTKESGIPTKLALQELNANPDTTIMIGDAPMDYVSAKNAGIEKVILVTTGQVDSKKLSEYSQYVLKVVT